MGDWLESRTIRDWARAALVGFDQARAELDELNVFPVPDGDTGTNMLLTFQAAAAAVEELFGATDSQPTPVAVAEAFASGALLGARGNSGVISSQILRGFATTVRSVGSAPASGGVAGSGSLAAALAEASRLAYDAVGDPKEGTILSVIRAAAAGAAQSVETADASSPASLGDVAEAALQAARAALELTPQQLPVLAEAGVVDAGGAGCVVLLEALLQAVTGCHRQLAPAVAPRVTGTGMVQAHSVRYGGPAFEVMFLLEAPDGVIPDLRERLCNLGDSLVVVGGEGLWNVHVHVDDVGAAIEAGIEAGRPYRIKVTHLLDSPRASAPKASSLPRVGRTLVAVTHGPGVAALLADAGVTSVMARPDTRPSTQELLDAVTAAGTAEVVLLPSDRDTRPVADAAAELARKRGIRVAVIPTRSIVQTLAAVAVHDANVHFDDDVVAMGREAGATRYGAVAIAAREVPTRAGPCHVGDVIGLVDGDIEVIGASLPAVAIAVLRQLIRPGSELVTLVWGLEATDDLTRAVADELTSARPDLELEVVVGGQPRWPLIVGVT